MSSGRPAFYALGSGGWRDYVTLLHLPYTAWHLSYVAIGVALAPRWEPRVLGVALAAFALAVGVGAHALDELHGRPLGTAIPASALASAAALSVAAATGLGVWMASERTWWLLAFVGAGAFLVCAYNLELLGGAFHSDTWFALAWGSLPLLASYLAAARELSAEAILAAAAAGLVSFGQRVLSTEVRTIRRSVDAVSGALAHRDGRIEEISAGRLIAPPELALKAFAGGICLLAAALCVLRAT